MDKERKAEIWVGITVSVALLILVFGIIWGKGSNFLFKRIILTAHFQDVRGLEKGDPVSVRGIEMGEVSSIALANDYAEVRLRINKGIPLCSDAQVFIEDKDLMGSKQVALFPGNSHEPLDDHRILIGITKVNILDILTGAERLMTQTEYVLSKFKAWIDQGRMDNVLKNVENTSLEASRILAENRKSIHAIVLQMEKIAKTFKEDSTTERFNSMVSQMDSTLTFLNRIAVETGKATGTLGKLIYDKKLYDHLLKASVDLDSLIADVKRNPKRYIHVSVF